MSSSAAVAAAVIKAQASLCMCMRLLLLWHRLFGAVRPLHPSSVRGRRVSALDLVCLPTVKVAARHCQSAAVEHWLIQLKRVWLLLLRRLFSLANWCQQCCAYHGDRLSLVTCTHSLCFVIRLGPTFNVLLSVSTRSRDVVNMQRRRDCYCNCGSRLNHSSISRRCSQSSGQTQTTTAYLSLPSLCSFLFLFSCLVLLLFNVILT